MESNSRKTNEMSKVLTPRETQLRDIIVGQRLSENALSRDDNENTLSRDDNVPYFHLTYYSPLRIANLRTWIFDPCYEYPIK